MCILFIAQGCHPRYPLVIAANRDEYFARPSEPMHFWPDHPEILAGRDVEAGGTWLGINRAGLFAAVTNFRGPARPVTDARSRGNLVVQFLDHTIDDRKYIAHLQSEHHTYNPFNLVFGSMQQLYAWDHTTTSSRALHAGFHSVSNGAIDQTWPKMARGVARLRDYVEQRSELIDSELIEVMQDRTRAPADQLPETGLDPAREQALSSIFIGGADYGTRTTTILLFNQDSIQVTERNYIAADAGGEPGPVQRYTVPMQQAAPFSNSQLELHD